MATSFLKKVESWLKLFQDIWGWAKSRMFFIYKRYIQTDENKSKCCHSTVSASVASVSVCYCLPGKDPITQRCKTTPDRKQYLDTWSEAALIHSCQWIWRSPFPLCMETQRRCTVHCWPLKLNRPNPRRYLLAPLQTTLLSQGCGWKSCQQQLCLLLWTNCSFTSWNVSRPSARQIQHDSGQWPPQGNIYQLLHLDPVALTLDLLPWQTPFTLNLLNLTVNDIR